MLKSIWRLKPLYPQKDPLAFLMDIFATGFLSRYSLVILSGSSIFNKTSFVLLLLWTILAVMPDNGRSLWNAMRYSKGVMTGLLIFSIWIITDDFFRSSPDSLIDWIVMSAIPVYMLSSYYGKRYPDRYWRILWIIILTMGIQAAYSIPHLISFKYDPKIVMHATNFYGKDVGSAYIREAGLHGIGSYSHYLNNALIATIAAGFAFSKRKNILKTTVMIFCWISLIIANLLSTFAASTQIVLLGSVIFLIYSLFVRKISFSGVVVTVIVISVGGLLMFDQIMQAHSYKYTFDKTIKIFKSVDGGDLRKEETGRGELLFRSLNAIASNPLLGYGTEGYHSARTGERAGGGHSTWLNMIVNYGFIGSLWFFIMFFSIGIQIRRAVAMRKGDLFAISFLIAYACFFIYGIIDTVSMDLILFFVLFGSSLALQKDRSVRKQLKAV